MGAAVTTCVSIWALVAINTEVTGAPVTSTVTTGGGGATVTVVGTQAGHIVASPVTVMVETLVSPTGKKKCQHSRSSGDGYWARLYSLVTVAVSVMVTVGTACAACAVAALGSGAATRLTLSNAIEPGS